MYGIENLKARYKMDGINVELSVDIDMDSNLPYDLANLFAKIMNDSHVNTDMVIENLIDEFGYQEKNP